jgi:2-polyprenyl-6-methoxyphenol hydroxylase-like FAD-dependent oxidoreductase
MHQMPENGSRRTAVVVGGGVGGLAAARALQLVGWTVQVLEQAPRLDALGAGISLWPNAGRALQALTVPFHHPGVPSAQSGLRTSSGRWLARTDPSTYPARYGAPLVAVHRAELQQALLDSLEPGTVITGARVTHVAQGSAHPRQVVVEHSRGSHQVDLAVLADGLNSTTRHLVTGPRPRPRYAGYTAWRGLTRPDAGLPAAGGATESWGRGQRFGIVPLADGRTYWFATANAPEGQHAQDSEHAEVSRRFAGWHPPISDVVQASAPDAVLRHDVYDLRPDPGSYVRGRLVLLGDAGHAMTPNLGQGACQALEDAATLGALLQHQSDVDSALRGYDVLRRPRAQGISRRSRQVGRIGQLSGRATTTARNLLVWVTPAALAERQYDGTLSWKEPSD